VTPRIKILSESLANKIAAGEVVERPASVVKELVENALDAGATDIRLEITNGGRRLIRVTDNGHGMSREDSLLALERHATSKLASDADLDCINTLGFRGEALPAIASVARLRLKSRQAGTIEGSEINLEGGRINAVAACGMAPGTDITVEQLFFNTPARLKFLRSTETEAAHVGDLIVRLAISRPDVAFCYVNDGRELFRVSAGDLLQRLQRLMARNATLYPFEGETDAAMVSGYLAPPVPAAPPPMPSSPLSTVVSCGTKWCNTPFYRPGVRCWNGDATPCWRCSLSCPRSGGRQRTSHQT